MDNTERMTICSRSPTAGTLESLSKSVAFRLQVISGQNVQK
jgi:hypothetical protein